MRGRKPNRKEESKAMQEVPISGEVDAYAPAGNTRVQKKQAAIRAATKATPTAKGTRESSKAKTRKSQRMRPTVSSRSKTRTGRALAFESRSVKRK